MTYDILVTSNDSPSKVRKWGYLIKSVSREDAKEKALRFAKDKADKPYSRYKKCTFGVKEEDIVARLDW